MDRTLPGTAPPLSLPGGRALSISLVAALVLVACGGSGYAYVRTGDSKAYFKVPTDWKRFTEKEILVASGLNDSPAAADSYRFLEAWDGSAEPSLAHVTRLVPVAPVVRAEVRTLSPVLRDQISLGSLRNFVLSVDELAANGSLEVLDVQDLVFPGGAYGSRLAYNVDLSAISTARGDGQLHVDQIGVLDPAASLVYFFYVQCTTDCYTQHQGTFDAIMASYTIKES
jgi:hypothetical protein